MFTIPGKYLAGVLTLFLCLQAPAQENSGGPAAGIPAIEEITVIGMRDILALQNQLYLAEDRFYERYNRLNDDDAYDIRCRMRAPLGTRIKRRECTPKFYTIATADYADALLEGRFMVPVTTRLAVLYPKLEEKMKVLVLEDQDLFNRVTEVFELTEKLEEKRRVYFGPE